MRAVGRQAEAAELLLVPLRVGAGGEEQHDLARLGRARVHELAHAARDVARLPAPPVLARVRVARLVGHEQLDRVTEDRVGEVAGGRERLELVAELLAEEEVDGGEHLGPRAVVARQRKPAAGPLAALAEDGHVRVPEPVDRLELVADEEHLAFAGPSASRSTSSHWRRFVSWNSSTISERKRSCSRSRISRVVAEEVARRELEILEVERRLALLGAGVRLVEAVEELLQELAVAGRDRVERRLLDPLPRFLVARGALAPGAERGQVEQPVRQRPGVDERQQRGGVVARKRGRGRIGREAPGSLAEVVEPLVERRGLAELEHERSPGSAQGLVDADQHPAEPRTAVRDEQSQAFGLVARAEGRERLVERLAAKHLRLRLVELAEPRVEPGRERMRAQEPVAEAVDRRDPGAVELAGRVRSAAREQRLADARAKLAGSLARVRDDEDRVDVEPVVADGAREALDEHGRLAGARTRGDEHLAVAPRRRRAARGSAPSSCVCLILQTVQRSHQDGHSSPFGSCRDVALLDAHGELACLLPRRLDARPERLVVDVVVVGEARQDVLARLLAQQAAHLPRAGERPVQPAQRLDADEVAEHEHVQRDLEPQLLLDLRRRVRRLARLVVDHDPARAERIDVDAVDLPGERHPAEVDPALQLLRRALRAERDLEPPGHERQRLLRLGADERLEVAPAASGRARGAACRSCPCARRASASSRQARMKRTASSTRSASTRSEPSSFGSPEKKRFSAVCATLPRSLGSTSASIDFGSRKRSTNHADEQSANRSSSVTPNESRAPRDSSTSGCVSRVRRVNAPARAVEPPLPAVRARERGRLGRLARVQPRDRTEALALGPGLLQRPRERGQRSPHGPAGDVVGVEDVRTSSQNGLGSRGEPSSVAASRTR